MLMKANRLLDTRHADSFDAVFVNRDLAGGGLFFERRLLKKNPRLVFDFDDAIFIGRNEPAVRWMCQNAAWVTAGNKYLAEYACQYSDRVTVLPSVVDTSRYMPGSYQGTTKQRPIRVGWSGSNQSIRATLFPYLEMLTRHQEHLDFEFVIISNSKPQLPLSRLRWTYWEWSSDQEEELVSSLDVGIMPLADNAFQRGKCGLKLLQYMAAGIPTVASPVGMNQQIVQHGVTGFLASWEDEWYEALGSLIRDPALRSQMGCAGRQRCENEYSIHKWFPVLLERIEHVARGSDRI